MKDKILALLEKTFPGVRKDGLNQLAGAIALQVTTEEETNAVVGKLTADRVNSFVNDWRKEADAEIERANQTRETNLRKKFDFVEKKTEGDTPPVQTPSGILDAAAIQKLIADSIAVATKPLLEQINTFKAGETTKTRLQALTEKLGVCKDENLKSKILKDFARMQFDTDEAFTEYLTETETDVKTANQNVADSGLGAQGRPWVPNVQTDGKEATEAEINAVMDKLPI